MSRQDTESQAASRKKKKKKGGWGGVGGGGGGATVCRDCGVCAVTYSPKPRFRLGYLVDLSSWIFIGNGP